MRKNDDQHSAAGAAAPVEPKPHVRTCGVGIVTGTRSADLAEHARALSNQTLEPVLQYVFATASKQHALLRRHWLAGLAPTVTLIAENPDCIGCAIGADLIRFAADNDTSQLAAILPPGTDATHMAQTVDRQPHAHTRYVRALVDAHTVMADLASNDDLDNTEMVSWYGDQRWVAHAVIGLITTADQVLISGDYPAPETIAVIKHLNPAARLHFAPPQFDESPATFRNGPTTRRDPYAALKQPCEPAAGVRTSIIHEELPIHPQRLLDEITAVAGHVIRIDGDVWLASQSELAFRLHASAGIASLDPRGPWEITSDDSTQRAPVTRLVVTTTETAAGNDPHVAVVLRMRASLLTRDEFGAGRALWDTFDDPFTAI
ncbi:MAG: GTP-binding protein [Actinobacteria bacterium]|nr:GTP-binding protein [Actinomycetota bacterium]